MTVKVIYRPKPIDPRVWKFEAEAGRTIQDLVDEANAPHEAKAFFQVRVNEGSPIPRAWWPHVRVRDGARVVMAPVYAGGGAGGGAGQKASAILPALGLLANAIPGVGTLASIAIGVALAGASAYLATRKPKSLIGKNDSPGAQPAAGFSANQLAPYDQIPMVLGRMRTSPNLLTGGTWIEFNQTNIVLRGAVGLQGATDLSDIRANGVLANDFAGLEYEVFEGDGAAPTITLLDHVGITDEVGITMSKHDAISDNGSNYSLLRNADALPQFHSFLSKDSPDEIDINLILPQGIVGGQSVAFRLQMRLKGAAAWRKLPELWMSPKADVFTLRKIRLKWFGKAGLDGELTQNDAFFLIADLGVAGANWTADTYFNANAQGNLAGHTTGLKTPVQFNDDDDTIPLSDGYAYTIWLHVDEWPQGKYEFQIMRSAITGATPNDFNGDGSGHQIDPFGLFNGGGTDFRIAPPQLGKSYGVDIHSITYKWFESPMQRPNTACIVFELKNAQIDHLTALCISKTEIPATGSSGFSSIVPTSNPAALWRYVLTNSNINHKPKDSSQVPDAFLETWFDYCELHGLECNCVIESGTVDDILPIIARAGDGVLDLSAKEWKIWIDRDRSNDVPTVIWSPRNCRDFLLKVNFEPVPSVIKATFLDEDDDNAQHEIFVDRDGEIQLPADDDEVLSIDMRGMTNRDKVIRYCKRQVRTGYFRRRTYTWETNVANLAVELGDLNGIAHDVLGGFFGWGYIIDVQRTTGGTITAITLDAKISLPQGTPDILAEPDILAIDDILAESTAWVAITLRDGSNVVEAEVNSDGLTNVLTFTTPIPDDVLIDVQCHVAVSIHGRTHRRVIITDKQPGADLTARLTAVDEAPEIFEGEIT